MNKDEYLEKRNELLAESFELLDKGDENGANAVLDKVDAMDAEWETFCKNTANAAALNGLVSNQNISDPGVSSVPDFELTAKGIKFQTVDFALDNEKESEVLPMNKEINPKEAYKEPLYATAWAKSLMKKPLTEDENEIYRMVNEDYVHTTGNTGEVVPESVAQGIWTEIEGRYPFYADITKTTVNGIMTIIRSKEYTDATWYEEAEDVEDGKETFDTLQLNGCTLARSITVSFKLRDMAIDEFVPYIQSRMAERMGAALGYGVMQGAGPEASKPEPMGIITALEADKNQIVTTSKISYDDIISARALINSGYSNGLKAYASAKTIWGQLAAVKDDTGRPIFVPDPAESGIYRILGSVVEEDSSVPDGDLLFGNAPAGYHANINKQITLLTEDHAKSLTTDYVAYAIIDGAPVTYNAFSLVKSGE